MIISEDIANIACRNAEPDHHEICSIIALLSCKRFLWKSSIDIGFIKLRRYKSLMLRVLSALHMICIPNMSQTDIEKNIRFLCDPEVDIGAVLVWLGEQEHLLELHKKLLQDFSLISKQDCMEYLWTISNDYENISHVAVLNDDLELTYLLCSLESAQHINQGNRMCETAAHIAANQFKLSHLRIFLQTKAFDYQATDRDGCTFLHRLLRRALQSTATFSSYSQLCHLISIIQNNNSNNRNSYRDMILIEDNCQLNILDYAIGLAHCPTVSILLDMITVFGFESQADRYVKHSILSNKPSVLATIIPYFLKTDIALCGPGEQFTKYLNFAIIHNKLSSLSFLLTVSQFHNSMASQYHGNIPLQVTITAAKTNSAATEMLRVLLNHGANSLQQLKPRPITCIATNSRYDYNLERRLLSDNSFSEATIVQNIDVVRTLLLNQKHESCSVFNNSHRANQYESHHCYYYFNNTKFSSNPITQSILSTQSDGGNALHMLEYLLNHTPFIELVNMQDCFTGLNPPCAAVLIGSKASIEMLFNHGGDPSVYLNTSLLFTDIHANQITELNKMHAAMESIQVQLTEKCQTLSLSSVLESYKDMKNCIQNMGEVELEIRSAINKINVEELTKLCHCILVSDNQLPSQKTSFPTKITISSEQSKFMRNFVLALEMLHHNGKFSLIRNPTYIISKLLDCLNMFTASSDAENCGNDICEQLSTALKIADESYASLSDLRKPIAVGLRRVIGVLSTTCHFLVILNTYRKRLNAISELKVARLLENWIVSHKNFCKSLEVFMKLSRKANVLNVLALNKYLGGKRFLESTTVELYSSLTCRHFCENMPSLFDADNLWWWDVMHVRDWSLFEALIPQLLAFENDSNIEKILIAALEYDAPSEVVKALLRSKIKLNVSYDILRKAIKYLDPELFLLVYFSGSCALPSDLWSNLIDQLLGSFKKLSYHVLPESKFALPSSTLFESYQGPPKNLIYYSASSLLEILRAGKATNTKNSPDLAPASQIRISSAIFRMLASITKDVRIQQDSLSDSSDSISFQDDVAMPYVCESYLSRTKFGDMTIFMHTHTINSVHEDNEHLTIFDGALGINGELIKFPTINMYSNGSELTFPVNDVDEYEFFYTRARQCTPVFEKYVMSYSDLEHSSIFNVMDRFLLTPFAIIDCNNTYSAECNLNAMDDAKQKFLCKLFTSDSGYTTHFLNDAFLHFDWNLKDICMNVEGKMMSALSFCASHGKSNSLSVFLNELSLSSPKKDYNALPYTKYFRYRSCSGPEINPVIMISDMESEAARVLLHATRKYRILIDGIKSYVIANKLLGMGVGEVEDILDQIVSLYRAGLIAHKFMIPWSKFLEYCESCVPSSMSGSVRDLLSVLSIKSDNSLRLFFECYSYSPITFCEKLVKKTNSATLDELLDYVSHCVDLGKIKNDSESSACAYWLFHVVKTVGVFKQDITGLCAVLRKMHLIEDWQGQEMLAYLLHEASSTKDDKSIYSENNSYNDSADRTAYNFVAADLRSKEISAVKKVVKDNARQINSAYIHRETFASDWYPATCLPLLSLSSKDLRAITHYQDNEPSQYLLNESDRALCKKIHFTLESLARIQNASKKMSKFSSHDCFVSLTYYIINICDKRISLDWQNDSEVLLIDTLLAQTEDSMKSRMDLTHTISLSSDNNQKEYHSYRELSDRKRNILHFIVFVKSLRRIINSSNNNSHSRWEFLSCCILPRIDDKHQHHPDIDNPPILDLSCSHSAEKLQSISRIFYVLHQCVQSRSELSVRMVASNLFQNLLAMQQTSNSIVPKEIGHGLLGIPLTTWHEASVVGSIPIFEVLLGLSTNVMQLYNHCDTSFANSRNWGILHSLLTGFTTSEDALNSYRQEYSNYFKSENSMIDCDKMNANVLLRASPFDIGYIDGKSAFDSKNKCKIVTMLLNANILFATSCLHHNKYPFTICDLLSMHGHWEPIRLLMSLDNSIPIVLSDSSCCTLLHSAALYRQHFVFDNISEFVSNLKNDGAKKEAYVDCLLKINNALNSKRRFIYCTWKTKRAEESKCRSTPDSHIYVHSLLHDAIASGDEKLAEKIIRLMELVTSELKNCESDYFIDYEMSHNVLHYAIYMRMPAIVKYLISRKTWEDILNEVATPPLARLDSYSTNSIEACIVCDNLYILKIIFAKLNNYEIIDRNAFLSNLLLMSFQVGSDELLSFFLYHIFLHSNREFVSSSDNGKFHIRHKNEFYFESEIFASTYFTNQENDSLLKILDPLDITSMIKQCCIRSMPVSTLLLMQIYDLLFFHLLTTEQTTNFTSSFAAQLYDLFAIAGANNLYTVGVGILKYLKERNVCPPALNKSLTTETFYVKVLQSICSRKSSRVSAQYKETISQMGEGDENDRRVVSKLNFEVSEKFSPDNNCNPSDIEPKKQKKIIILRSKGKTKSFVI